MLGELLNLTRPIRTLVALKGQLFFVLTPRIFDGELKLKVFGIFESGGFFSLLNFALLGKQIVRQNLNPRLIVFDFLS